MTTREFISNLKQIIHLHIILYQYIVTPRVDKRLYV